MTEGEMNSAFGDKWPSLFESPNDLSAGLKYGILSRRRAVGCGRWRGAAGAHDRLGRGPSVASPVRGRRRSPSPPHDRETTGGGDDGGGGEDRRTDGEGTGAAGRARLPSGRQTTTYGFPGRGSVSSEGFADQERRRAGTTEAGAVTGWYGTQGQDKCRDDRNTQLWQSALILDEAV